MCSGSSQYGSDDTVVASIGTTIVVPMLATPSAPTVNSTYYSADHQVSVLPRNML